MCDYSLDGVASRPARTGDKLVTTQFPLTRGFSAIRVPDVAVCLRRGTEIAFDSEVQIEMSALRRFLRYFFGNERSAIGHKVGRFKQLNVNIAATHHDAIEFPDGQIVLLTRLSVGQRATVLQLPIDMEAQAATATRTANQRASSRISGAPAMGWTGPIDHSPGPL
jgi:hypothetical protein